MAQRTPFRQQALQFYQQQDQPVVLPRFVSLRLAALLWGVLVLLVGTVFAAWLIQIPSYATVSGVVQAPTSSDIVLFLPFNKAARVHRGIPVQVQIGTSGPAFSTSVTTVEAGVMSPDEARQRYGLGSSTWRVVTEPSVALLVPLAPGFAEQAYAGSLVSAQVQIGSAPVFTLLPGFTSSPSGEMQ